MKASNTDGLRRSAEEKKNKTDAKVKDAAEKMILSGELITKSSLAKKAGVSREYIRKSETWSRFVEEHSGKSQPSPVMAESAVKKALENSSARLSIAHQANDSLQEENCLLREQLAELRALISNPIEYDQSIKKLKEENKELKTKNKELNEQIKKLETQLKTAYIWNESQKKNTPAMSKMVGIKDL